MLLKLGHINQLLHINFTFFFFPICSPFSVLCVPTNYFGVPTVPPGALHGVTFLFLSVWSTHDGYCSLSKVHILSLFCIGSDKWNGTQTRRYVPILLNISFDQTLRHKKSKTSYSLLHSFLRSILVTVTAFELVPTIRTVLKREGMYPFYFTSDLTKL